VVSSLLEIGGLAATAAGAGSVAFTGGEAVSAALSSCARATGASCAKAAVAAPLARIAMMKSRTRI
jgi:hypothetical protein